MRHMCIASKVIPSVYHHWLPNTHIYTYRGWVSQKTVMRQYARPSPVFTLQVNQADTKPGLTIFTSNATPPIERGQKTEAVTTCTLLQMSTMTWKKKKKSLLNEENLDVLRQKFLLLPPSSTAYCPEKYWYKTCHQLCVEACYSVGSLTWHGDHMRRTDTMYSFLCTDNIVYYTQVNE